VTLNNASPKNEPISLVSGMDVLKKSTVRVKKGKIIFSRADQNKLFCLKTLNAATIWPMMLAWKPV
jgi:hypothetical protein